MRPTRPVGASRAPDVRRHPSSRSRRRRLVYREGVGDGVALGMRRLSIIDLAGGHQPIQNEDGSVRVVFNGEIYNYRELRAELRARYGHRFSTDTDTETIVHAYEQWGEESFSRICVGCSASRSGIAGAARCCWRAIGSASSRCTTRSAAADSGSDPKSSPFSRRARSSASLNASALEHYLAFLYTPADASIFKGIRKLPPGHLLRWRDGGLSMRRYWDLPAGGILHRRWSKTQPSG